MPLTILFDADDTVENLVDCWIAALNERYGTSATIDDVKQWDISPVFPGLTRAQIYGILHEDAFWSRLQPIPGSQRVLQRLYEEGYELYMVTASDYRTCKAKFDRILSLFPFLDAHHIIITSNKQMVKGDILIDDGPHNLESTSCAKLLFDRPHNRKYDAEGHGMIRVYDWDEIYRLIANISGGNE